MLTSPTFPEDSLVRMKTALEMQLKDNMADQDWWARKTYFAESFKNHPYQFSVFGSLESIPNITTNDLRKYAQSNFNLAGIKMAVAGDITSNSLNEYLDENLQKLPANSVKMPPKAKFTSEGQTILVPWNGSDSSILMGFPSINKNDEDWYSLLLMNYILGGSSLSSRLMTAVREHNGLTYDIRSYPVNNKLAPFFAITYMTDKKNNKQALELVKTELLKIQQQIGDDEILLAKKYLVNSLPFVFTSSRQISAILLDLELNDLPTTYFDNYAEKLNKVKIGDVKKIAKQILDPNRATTVFVGASKDIDYTRLITPQ